MTSNDVQRDPLTADAGFTSGDLLGSRTTLASPDVVQAISAQSLVARASIVDLGMIQVSGGASAATSL